MSTGSTKHSAVRSSLGRAALPDVLQVPLPVRFDKIMHDQDAVTLGTQVPDGGRYNTLSRMTYQHGRAEAKVDEDPDSRVKRPNDIRQETVVFKTFMRNKNFAFGAEHEPHSLVTESRGAQGAAAAEAKRTHSPHAVRQERYNHIARMRSSNVFGATATSSSSPSSAAAGAGGGSSSLLAAATSTQRASYTADPSNPALSPSRRVEAILKQRNAHCGTHFSFGDESASGWRAESTSYTNGDGSQGRTQKCTRALECSIKFQTPGIDVKDTLKSLKQVDFASHDGVKRLPTAFSSSEHHMVMGYAPKQLVSLSQASYRPTAFVSPAPSSNATPSLH